MERLDLPRVRALPAAFFAAGPGPMVGQHVLNTGAGRVFADRFPDPRTVVFQSGHNFALAGDPSALPADALRRILSPGILDADRRFERLLREACDDLKTWDRIIFSFQKVQPVPQAPGFLIRRLTASDAEALEGLSASLHWIWDTWVDAAILAGSGFGWGAFQGARLVSVACSFFAGSDFEDIGVVTEPAYERRNLSTACVGQLCRDIVARGRLPSWSTSMPNIASQRVAVKCGFREDRRDFLFVIDSEIPD